MGLFLAVSENEIPNRERTYQSCELREQGLPNADGRCFVWSVTMKKVLTVERDILQSRRAKSLLIFLYRHCRIVLVVVQHNRD